MSLRFPVDLYQSLNLLARHGVNTETHYCGFLVVLDQADMMDVARLLLRFLMIIGLRIGLFPRNLTKGHIERSTSRAS